MTQNEKDLLIKDLCSRLPYGVKCIEKTPIEDFKDKNLWEIDRVRGDTFMFGMSNCYVCYGQYDDIDNIKPYLFPFSSMTEEQKKELNDITDLDIEIAITNIKNDTPNYVTCLNRLTWLLKNHFDIYGLIPMGLANDATGLNIY